MSEEKPCIHKCICGICDIGPENCGYYEAEKTCYNKSKFSDCFECSECGFYTEDAAGLMIGELFKRCPVCETKVVDK